MLGKPDSAASAASLPRRRPPAGGIALAAVALLAGLALSAWAGWQQHASATLADRLRGERLAERGLESLRQALQTADLLARSLQTLFIASEEVDEREFRIAYEGMRPRESFPSLQALVFARRLPPLVEGAPERYVTEMVAPLAGNERVLGLDIMSQPANVLALEYSRDTNQPAMSAAFRLVQLAGDPDGSDGVVLRMPVYASGQVPTSVQDRRAQVAGSLGVSFRVGALIRHAMPADVLETARVRVFDVTEGQARLLFDSVAGAPVAGEALLPGQVRFGGRQWRLEVLPLAATGTAGGWLSWATFGVGALASLLLALLIAVLSSTRARALAMAGEMAERFRQSEARFRAVNELLPALVLLADARDGAIRYANAAARLRLWGDASEDGEAPGTPLGQVFEDATIRHRLDGLREDGAAGGVHSLHARLRDLRDGFWAAVSARRIRIGQQSFVLVVASDITEMRALTERLGYQATHDSLTELANRREFELRLDQAIAAVDAGGAPSALIYLDLDQFKLVNDTAGHMAGDQLLVQLAVVLKDALRPGDLLARVGGDEFGVLLANADETSARDAAERLRDRVDGLSFGWEDRSYMISASLGVVMVDTPGLVRAELLSLVDAACFTAKERGRNRVQVVWEADLETHRRRGEMEWVSRVRRALAEDRLELDFQELEPLKASRQRGGVHLEMLIRLRDEDGQRVPPGAFIPAAERYGLMPQLDRWVVDTTLRRFDALHPSGQPIATCAVNLSGATVDDEDFAGWVLDALARHGVPPERMCFEITETAAVSNLGRVVRLCERLRGAGCRIALDDFGAGMSSFGYLKNLPVDMIKIDGSFIRDLETDAMSYAIVRAITDIGHQLGLELIAEWVQNERSRELLRGLGVDYAQGFAIHRPQPSAYLARPAHGAGA